MASVPPEMPGRSTAVIRHPAVLVAGTAAVCSIAFYFFQITPPARIAGISATPPAEPRLPQQLPRKVRNEEAPPRPSDGNSALADGSRKRETPAAELRDAEARLDALALRRQALYQEFLRANPDMAAFAKEVTEIANARNAQFRTPGANEYTQWLLNGNGKNTKDRAARDQEVLQLRRQYFVKNLDELLMQEEHRELLTWWLSDARPQWQAQAIAPGYDSPLSGLGKQIFPSPALFDAYLAAPDRAKYLATNAAGLGLRDVTPTMPAAAMEHLDTLMRYEILAAAGDALIASRMPAELRSATNEHQSLSRYIANVKHQTTPRP